MTSPNIENPYDMYPQEWGEPDAKDKGPNTTNEPLTHRPLSAMLAGRLVAGRLVSGGE